MKKSLCLGFGDWAVSPLLKPPVSRDVEARSLSFGYESLHFIDMVQQEMGLDRRALSKAQKFCNFSILSAQHPAVGVRDRSPLE